MSGPIRRTKKVPRTPTSITSAHTQQRFNQTGALPVHPGSHIVHRTYTPRNLTPPVQQTDAYEAKAETSVGTSVGTSAEIVDGMVVVPPAEPMLAPPHMSISIYVCVECMPAVQTCVDVIEQIANVYGRFPHGMQITPCSNEISLSVNLPVHIPTGQTTLSVLMRVVHGQSPFSRVRFRGPVQVEKIWDVLIPFAEKYAENQLIQLMTGLSL